MKLYNKESAFPGFPTRKEQLVLYKQLLTGDTVSCPYKNNSCG